jgi:hypothetical protein
MNEIGQAINLLDGAQFAAGKNKIINGDFGVWQRGTSFTLTPSLTYTADRFGGSIDGTGVCTFSRQTFTPGTAPVAGYEGTFFLRSTKTAGTTNTYGGGPLQKIEDVRTLAGQTVTLSFWAKADAAITINAYVDQNFGSGGSAGVGGLATTVNLTTAWQRFTSTFTMPSIAGKTIGTSSFVEVALFKAQAGAYVLDFWGIQLEAASTASPFQTATGTKQGELAACQRYYWRTSAAGAYAAYGVGSASSTTQALIEVKLPVTMRTAPVSLDFSTIAIWDTVTITATTSLGINASGTSADFVLLSGAVASGLTQYRTYYAINNNNTAGYIALSAEL